MENTDQNKSDEEFRKRLHNLEQRFSTLENRIKRLEEKLEEARQIKKSAPERETGQGGTRKTGRSYQPTSPKTDESANTWNFLEQSSWLNKLGVLLLIVGLLLLFKYSVEQGWITPPVRLAAGLILSLGLMVWGFTTNPDRTRFRQATLGGGLAGLYITGFAAYYLYHYLGFISGWFYMLALTGGALYLALKEDEPVLGILGIVGGLATPFLLYREGSQFVELIGYTTLLSTVSAVIYFQRRWVSLLWCTIGAGLAVYGVILIHGIFDAESVPVLRRWVAQGGLLIFLGLFWQMPIYRNMLSLEYPDRWEKANPRMSDFHLPIIIMILPLCIYWFSMGAWEWSADRSGWIALLVAGGLGLIYLEMPSILGRRIKQYHVYEGFVLMAFGLWLLFVDEYLYAWLALQLFLMHFMAYATSDGNLRTASHLLAFFIGIWTIESLIEPNPITLSGANLAEWTVTAGMLGSAVLQRRYPKEFTVYSLGALVFFLAWIANFFWTIPNGHVYITISWGVMALLILGFGYRKAIRLAKRVGAGTLLLTLAKLVFFDLSHLDTIWRITLFLLFGIVLLATGYWLEDKR